MSGKQAGFLKRLVDQAKYWKDRRGARKMYSELRWQEKVDDVAQRAAQVRREIDDQLAAIPGGPARPEAPAAFPQRLSNSKTVNRQFRKLQVGAVGFGAGFGGGMGAFLGGAAYRTRLRGETEEQRRRRAVRMGLRAGAILAGTGAASALAGSYVGRALALRRW